VNEDIGQFHTFSIANSGYGSLVHLSLWNVDTLLLTGSGKPVGMIRSLQDESHVTTRLAQNKATENPKGVNIAKQIVLKRIESQNLLLREYGLRQLDVIRMKESIRQL
jgi:CRISPR/Cas system-associated endonuclease Cas1